MKDMKLNDLREQWDAAGGGVKAASKLENGKFLLPLWKGDHDDFCNKCDHGGTLLCCDFCQSVSHTRCLDSPVRGVAHAKYWACDACSDRMWRNFAGIKTAPKKGQRKAEEESPFVGVTKCGDKWEASFMSKSGCHYLGTFDTPEEAAVTHDIEARKCFGDAATTNFSLSQLLQEDEFTDEKGITLKGVCFSYGSWRSSIVYGNHVKHLGFFDTKEMAALAYDRASKYYHGVTFNEDKITSITDNFVVSNEDNMLQVKTEDVGKNKEESIVGDDEDSINTSLCDESSISSCEGGVDQTPRRRSRDSGSSSGSYLSEDHTKPNNNSTSEKQMSSKLQGYYAPPSNKTNLSTKHEKLSAEVLGMKQRRARQMVGSWQPVALGPAHQAEINSENTTPAVVRSEFKWNGCDDKVLDSLKVPAVHQELSMQLLFKHRMNREAAAAALVKSISTSSNTDSQSSSGLATVECLAGEVSCRRTRTAKRSGENEETHFELSNDVSAVKTVTGSATTKHNPKRQKSEDDTIVEHSQRVKSRSSKSKDFTGWSHEEILKGEEAFMLCGRNISAARGVLGWPMKRAVCFYYTVWKYSPSYHQWKVSGKKSNTILVASSSLLQPAPQTISCRLNDRTSLDNHRAMLKGNLMSKAVLSHQPRFRGPRMRSVTRKNYKI